MAATGAVGLLTATAAAMAGLHPFVSIGLLLAVTVAVLMRLGGNATVRLTDAGIERTVTPLMARVVAWPDRHQHIGFGDIRAYRRDSDRSRFRGEVAYLTLSLRRPPFRATIHDMGGRRRSRHSRTHSRRLPNNPTSDGDRPSISQSRRRY